MDEGITRLKSGRSDIKKENRSESMSCSDKIMSWNVLGIQGSLIGQIINKPVYISSVIIENTNYNDQRNQKIVERGLIFHKRLEFCLK